MDIEVSLKIRSAIKAKLVELGCHVDEELPDYIMVLIANRRTRSHMEEDLFLFLGDNTNTFTIWLHHVLKKLEEITTSTTGLPSLFGNSSTGGASTSVTTVDDNISFDTQNSTQAVQDSLDHVEKTEDKKRSKDLERVQKKKRRLSSESPKKDKSKKSSKKIKINKNNFDVMPPPEDKKTLTKDSRVSRPRSSSKTDKKTYSNEIQIPDVSAVVDEVNVEPIDNSITDELGTATTTPADESVFKIPNTIAKKIKLPKRKSLKEPDDDDFDDYLNLKAESDDLFLEPGTHAKLKISKKSTPPPPKIVDSEDEAKELELLRQKVIESTKRKKTVERLTEPPAIIKLVEPTTVATTTTTTTINELPEKIMKNFSIEIHNEAADVNVKCDRKKISTKNIENLKSLIKSNAAEVKRDHKIEPSSKSHLPTKSKKDDELVDRHKSRHSREKDMTDRDSKHKSSQSHSHKRKLDHHEIESHSNKQLRSSIGTIINRPIISSSSSSSRRRFEKEEEYDPSCPEVNNKLQSIVQVPKDSKKPKLIQETNKKLLFRAIADAEKSLLQTRQIKSQYEEKESEMELKNMKNKKTYVTRTKKSIHDRLGYIDNKKQEEKVEQEQEEDEEEIEIVEEWEYPEDDDDLEMSNFNNFEGDETIIINIPNESNVGRNVSLEPKDNVDNTKIVQRHQPNDNSYTGPLLLPKRISIQVHSDDDDDDDDSTTTDDENNNSEINTSEYKSEGSPNISNTEATTSDFEITLNDSNTKLSSSEDQIERENGESIRNDLIRNDPSNKKTITRPDSKIQITVNNDITPTTSPNIMMKQSKIFQPTFPLQLQHPHQQQQQSSHHHHHHHQQQKQLCKFWPNCTFSDKCIYTHPPCKYNTKCTKPNCPYKHIGFIKNTMSTHKPHPKLFKPMHHSHALKSQVNINSSSSSNNRTSTSTNSKPKNTIKTCIYFPKCHTLNCPFFHPTPCRYGTGCNDLKCQNYHPGVTIAKKKFNTTTKNKKDMFKWKAPLPVPPPVIIPIPIPTLLAPGAAKTTTTTEKKQQQELKVQQQHSV